MVLFTTKKKENLRNKISKKMYFKGDEMMLFHFFFLVFVHDNIILGGGICVCPLWIKREIKIKVPDLS